MPKKKKQSDGIKSVDPRLNDVAKNPLFRQSRKATHQENKAVVQDERFSSMFTDPSFQITTKDTRGRPVLHTNEQSDPALLYGLKKKNKHKSNKEETSEDVHMESDSDDEKSGVEKSIENEEQESSSSEEDSEEDLPYRVDRARGIGLAVASDAEDTSDSEREDNLEEEADYSGSDVEEEELPQKEVIIVEDSTHRLAVQNLDWTIIRARDLLVLFRSFCPEDGKVNSVSIVPSKYGMERLAVERESGPIELTQLNEKTKGMNEEDCQSAVRKAIRKYQQQLCRYYFGVVVCDTPETSTAIYEALDGYEFEKSGCVIDLSFIPEDMDLEVPKEFQDCVSNCERPPRNYKNNPFFSKSKMVSKASVETLTWDTNPQDRARFIANCFKEDVDFHDLEQDDTLRQVLRMSSSEDEDEDEDVANLRKKLAPRLSAAEMRALLLGDDAPDKESEEEEVATDEEEELMKYVNDVVGSDEEDVKPKKKKKPEVEQKKKQKPENKTKKTKESAKKVATNEEEVESPVETAKDRKKKGKKDLEKQKKRAHKDKKRKIIEDKLVEEGDAELEILLQSNNKKRRKTDASVTATVSDDSRFAALKSDPQFRIDPNTTDFNLTKDASDLKDLLKIQQDGLQQNSTESKKPVKSDEDLTSLKTIGKQILGGMKTKSTSKKNKTPNKSSNLLDFMDKASAALGT